MPRLYVLLGLSLSICLPMLPAAPTATTLEPISPIGWDLAAESAVWSDGAGHVAAAVAGRETRADASSVPLLLYAQGAAWHAFRCNPPAGAGSVTHLELVGRAGDLSCLASFDRLNTVLCWRTANGTTWTGPTTAATCAAGASPDEFRAAYVADTPVVLLSVRSGAQAGIWLHARGGNGGTGRLLAARAISLSRSAVLQTDLRGRLYALGIGAAATPFVAGQLGTAGGSTLLPATQPTTGHLLDTPSSVVLDVARQQLVAVTGSEQSEALTATRLPLGALPGASTQARSIAPAPGRSSGGFWQLAAGPDGTTVLVRRWTLEGGAYAVAVTPLAADGPGAPVWLGRPGSQTEAAEFIRSPSAIAASVDSRGDVHVVLVSVKKGAVPSGRERLFYGRVSGLGLSGTVPASTPFDAGTTPPDQHGGGTVAPPDQPGNATGGPKPNLRGELRLASDQALPRYDLPYSAQEGLDLWLRLYCDGADYYGDLRCRIELGGVTLDWVWRDKTQHRDPLLRAGRWSESVPATLRFVTSEPTPPGVIAVERGDRKAIKLPKHLGRLPLRLLVDADAKVSESNEADNEARCEAVVYDGLNAADQQRDAAGKLTARGLNDVGLLDGRIYVKPNCAFARFGLLQSPTWLAVVVDNPRSARWMSEVKVTASLDGQPLGERLAASVPSVPTLTPAQLPWTMNAPGTVGAKTYRGTVVSWPLDLSAAALGDHTLRVEVDPDDQLGDRLRDNNVATLRLKVRPPGGTLLVDCLDSGSRAAIAGARVTIPDLWSMVTNAAGQAKVEDFPPGSYAAGAMLAERDTPTPKPYARKAAAPFSVHAGGTTTVTMLLDGPVTIVGRLTGPDGQPPTHGASVGFDGQHAGISYNRATGDYRVSWADPGSSRLSVWAYGYLPGEVQRSFIAGADGTCRADLTLAEAPKASVQGTITGATGAPLGGVEVVLSGTPSCTTSDAQGHFRIDGVMAGGNYGFALFKPDYVERLSYTTGTLRGGDLITCDMSMAKVSTNTAKTGAQVLTWALCESYPGFDIGSASSAGYKVKAYYGEFRCSLALGSYTVEGEGRAHLTGLALGITPGVFWKENVSFEWNPLDLVSGAVETVSGDLLSAAFGARGGKVAGQLAKLVDPLNSVTNLVSGDIDPTRLRSDDDEIIGTYTSHTGDKVEDTSLIELPSTDITVTLGAQGGRTTVRVDRVEIADSAGSVSYSRQWYSPRSAWYQLNREVDWASLEVRVYLQVMNEHLSVGPLYANSRNRLVWRPAQNRWLQFQPFAYEVD